MAILFQVLARQEELFVGLDLFGQQGGFGRIGDGTDFVGLGMPLQDGALPIDKRLHDFEGQFVELRAFHVNSFHQNRLWRERHFLPIVNLAIVIAKDNADFLLRSGKHLEGDHILFSF